LAAPYQTQSRCSGIFCKGSFPRKQKNVVFAYGRYKRFHFFSKTLSQSCVLPPLSLRILLEVVIGRQTERNVSVLAWLVSAFTLP